MSNNFELLSEHLKKVLTKNKNAYVVFQDGLECYVFGDFIKNCPDDIKKRIVNIGISEQNGVSVASGLAMGGKTVYLVLFASFLMNRALEQVKLDICYNNLNVKMFGINAGYSGMSVAGYSHITLGDIAIARALPNLEVLSTSPFEGEFLKILEYVDSLEIPSYIRMDYSGYPNDEKDYKFNIEKLCQIEKGKKTAILTTGSTIRIASDISDKISKIEHYKPSIYTVPRIKPFDEKGLKKIIKNNNLIITLEEHTYGGLSTVISEVIVQQDKKIAFLPIFVKDKNYNKVILSTEYCQEYLLEQSLIINKIIEHENKFRLIKRHYFKDKYDNSVVKYKFAGITLFKSVRKKYKKKHTPSHKFYLIGIRIL